MKFVGMILLLAGMSTAAMAGVVPEIDGSSGLSALALLGGALLVFKSRKR